MRGILIAVGLVLLAVLAWVLFGGPGADVRPDRPDSKVPEDIEELEILPPAPDAPDAPAAPVAPDTPAETVRVLTNVGGATVTLRIHLYGGLPDPDPLVRTADGEGSATFPVPETPEPIAEMIAEAHAPGHRSARAHVRDGVAQIELVPGFAVRGRVIDGAGLPIEHAGVSAGPNEHCRSGSRGEFRLIVAEAGPVELLVKHHAYLNTTVTAKAPAEGVEVVLDRGLTITGRVTFPDGKPVPESGLQTWNPHALATTDDDGRYVLSGYVPGTVEVQCFAAGEKREVETGASAVDFVVKHHVVRIRLTDEEGRPFRRASMWVRGVREGKECFSSAGSTGEDGIYRSVVVASGTELAISPSAGGREVVVTKLLIDGVSRLHDVVVVLPREGPRGFIDLRVLDDVGSPRSHAVARLTNEAGSGVRGFYGKKLELDAGGRCRLEVPRGRFELRVSDSDAFASAEGYALPTIRKIAVTAGEVLPVEAVLLTGGRVRATVRDAADEIVAAVDLDLLDGQGERIPLRFIRVLEGGWTTGLDEPGPALLGQPVPAGRYKVRCTPGDGVVVEEEVDILRGRTAEVTIRLPRR